MLANIIENRINMLKAEMEHEVNSRTKEILDYTITVLEEILFINKKQAEKEGNHIYM